MITLTTGGEAGSWQPRASREDGRAPARSAPLVRALHNRAARATSSNNMPRMIAQWAVAIAFGPDLRLCRHADFIPGDGIPLPVSGLPPNVAPRSATSGRQATGKVTTM